MDIFARITMTYQDLKLFFDQFAEVCEKLVVYEHTGTSREHVHFYAEKCSLKTDAIKARIKKHLHVTEFNKSNWSFKTAYDDGCIQYMTKGVLEPSYVKGFTREQIIVYRDRWQPTGAERPKGETETCKTKQITQYQMAMEVYDLVAENIENKNEYDIYRMCIRTAIRVCHKHKKGFDDNSIRKIAQPAFVKLAHMEDSFVEKCTQRFFS